MPTRVNRGILLIFLITLQMFYAKAQSPAEKQDSTLFELSMEELMNIPITTASKTSEKMSDAPATVYVITKDDIRKRGYIYLRDVLRDLPGTETIENYFSELGTLVPVRGVIGNNKLIVLLNGVRTNPPGGEETMFRSDFSIFSAYQIEIIYGPGSTLYGQDAINMIINIITKSPSSQLSSDVIIRGGQFNNKEVMGGISKQISFKSGGYIGLSSYVGYKTSLLSPIDENYKAWWENYEGVISTTGITGTPQRWDKGFNAFLKAETKNSSIQFWHRESSRSSSEGGYNHILQFVDEAVWHDKSTVLQFQNNIDLGEKATLESSMSYNRYEIDPETRYVFPIGSSVFLDDYKYGLGTGLRLEEKVNVQLYERLRLTGGLLIAMNDIIPKATIPGGVDRSIDITSQGGKVSYYTEKNIPESNVDVARVNNIVFQTYAGYLEGSYRLPEKFKVVLGMRVDKDTRFSDLPLSPRVALIYDINSNLSVKYIFNKAFVAPAPYYAFNVYDNGAGISVTNPNLLPERAFSNEINFNYTSSSLSVNSSFFLNKQENLLVGSDQALPVNIISDTVYLDVEGTQVRKLLHTSNSGETIAMGADLFFKYKTKKIDLWGSVSYVDFEQELASKKSGLNGISAVNIRAGISYNIIKSLILTPSLIYRSTPENIVAGADLTSEIKNPYEINLHVLYSPYKTVDCFINIRNLTNNRYALRGVLSPVPQETFCANAGIRFYL